MAKKSAVPLAGTRLSSAYQAGLQGRPFAKHFGSTTSKAYGEWKRGHAEYLLARRLGEPEVERGHWPKGKRRNPDSGQWSRTLLRLQKFLDGNWQRGVVTQTALAKYLGVSAHTVRRWLDRVDRPDVEHQEAVKAWIEGKSTK